MSERTNDDLMDDVLRALDSTDANFTKAVLALGQLVERANVATVEMLPERMIDVLERELTGRDPRIANAPERADAGG